VPHKRHSAAAAQATVCCSQPFYQIWPLKQVVTSKQFGSETSANRPSDDTADNGSGCKLGKPADGGKRQLRFSNDDD
jgi:hypothetical protein